MLCDRHFQSDMSCYVIGWYRYFACDLYFWEVSTPSQILLFVNLVPVFWVLSGCAPTVLHCHHQQLKTLFELCKEIKQINEIFIFKDTKRRHERILMYYETGDFCNLRDHDVSDFWREEGVEAGEG